MTDKIEKFESLFKTLKKEGILNKKIIKIIAQFDSYHQKIKYCKVLLSTKKIFINLFELMDKRNFPYDFDYCLKNIDTLTKKEVWKKLKFAKKNLQPILKTKKVDQKVNKVKIRNVNENRKAVRNKWMSQQNINTLNKNSKLNLPLYLKILEKENILNIRIIKNIDILKTDVQKLNYCKQLILTKDKLLLLRNQSIQLNIRFPYNLDYSLINIDKLQLSSIEDKIESNLQKAKSPKQKELKKKQKAKFRVDDWRTKNSIRAISTPMYS